jgi:hypothetical protein
MPYFGTIIPPPPTVLGLEKGVVYHAYYWEPRLGIRFDLGSIGLPEPGKLVLMDQFGERDTVGWLNQGPAMARRADGKLIAIGETLNVVDRIIAEDTVVAVDGRSEADAGLLLRYQDPENYVAAVYASKEKSLYIYMRSHGISERRLGSVSIRDFSAEFRLNAEVRSNMAAASITDGIHTYSTPILDLLDSPPWGPNQLKSGINAGRVGILHPDDGLAQHFDNFEVRECPTIAEDVILDRKLYDANGVYRGELNGPGWREFGMHKTILLGAYRPERFPVLQDWLLVLEAM